MNLRNEANSCFLDSLIVAMFTYGSPKNHFIEKLKGESKAPIIEEIKNIFRTKSQSSRNVRKYLPDEMHWGQHDPGETYLYLSSVMNYEPMKLTTIRQVMKPNSETIYKKKAVRESSPCYTIENTGADPISFFDVIEPDWEILESGNYINDAKDKPAYNRTRNLTFFTEAEILVFYFNRCQSSEFLGSSQGYPYQKVKNRLEMPFLFDAGTDPKTGKPREFFCYATILHLGGSAGGGHYVTVLYDGTDNFAVYDDMSGLHHLKWNSENKEMIERNSVLYFYYEK